MSMPDQGRHTGRARRTPTVRNARTTRPPRMLPHALRRPLASVAAIVAVAGASAAAHGSQAAATAHTSAASFTASAVAGAQSIALPNNGNDTDVALAEARRSEVQRASALTQQQAAALVQVRATSKAAAAFAKARGVAAERVARARVRRGLLARAQSDPQDVARLLVADRGWGGQQFDCLNSLWTKESGWRWDANNSGSGAYGIPQSLPGSKMASSGSDWATNPITQINWGLGYISRSYGTPCSAWAHSQASNWY
jgi:hypothetical protein